MREVGTANIVDVMDAYDLLPVHNYKYGSHENTKNIDSKILKAKYFTQDHPDGCWKGCTIDGEKRSLGPYRPVVEGVGHDFLTHPGFAPDQHRLRGPGNGLDVLEDQQHLLVTGNDLFKGVGLFQGVVQNMLPQGDIGDTPGTIDSVILSNNSVEVPADLGTITPASSAVRSVASSLCSETRVRTRNGSFFDRDGTNWGIGAKKSRQGCPTAHRMD